MEEIISEGAEYSPKSEFSKPRVCEKSVILCVEARGSEMRPGYFNTTIDKNGNPQRSWIQDSRKVFIGKVDALRGLLSPEIKRNKRIKEKLESLDERKKESFESCCYKEMKTIKDKDNYVIWIETNKNIMPEIDDPVVVVADPKFPNRASLHKGGWNLKVNSYWNELVLIYDEIFAELNDLMYDLNYFKAGINF